MAAGVLALLVACATPGAAEQPRTGQDTVKRTIPGAEDAGVTLTQAQQTVETAPGEGPCAEFNRQQANALSPEEHMRLFGCPPCPCACVNGKVTCAPCAACGAFNDPRRTDLRRGKEVAPQRRDAGV